MVVAKYGGTSMAKPEVVAEIVQANPNQKIIVCSAPGKSDTEKRKMTDLLIDLVRLKKKNQPTETKLDEIVKRFEQITDGLSADFREDFLKNLRNDLDENNDRNFIVSRGEYYSALAFAKRINYEFVDAKDIFYFHDADEIDRELTKKNIESQSLGKRNVVIPGFYGANSDGEIFLFSRGGSDRSGAIIAASLNADYENWTDVDGILSGDPEAVASPKVLSELTYEEVREGAHGGTGVLMGDSILDLEYGKGDVILLNTFNPECAGTRIKKSRNFDKDQPVVALSARDDLLALTIHDLGMRDSKGYLVKILNILAQNNISIEHMPTAQDSITITFHNDDDLNLDELKSKFDGIAVSPSATCDISECGVVYLVGESLRLPESQHKVMIEALQELEGHKIHVWAIVAHPDSPSVAVIIDKSDVKKAEQTLHDSLIN